MKTQERLNGIDVIYSPMLSERQCVKMNDRLFCGYSAYFSMLYNYGSLNIALDWGENLAKENLKQFINRI